MNNMRYNAKLFWLQSAARDILRGERVGACCRISIPGKNVEIWRHNEEKRAKYRNVVRCDNLWQCPVCANQITAHRRQELDIVVKNTPGIPIMLTFTMRHHRSDTLQYTVSVLCEAWAHMTGSRFWKEAKSDACLSGYVRALEVTWSQSNGWHPHFHALFIVDCGTRIARFFADTRKAWGEALVKNGGDCSYERGCTLTTADTSIAAYIAKWGHEPSPENDNVTGWGMVQEATRGVTKSAHDGGFTPFQMLEQYLLNGSAGPALWGRLYMEYAEAMRGQRQLSWSKNPDMRKIVGVKEKLDEQVFDDTDDWVLLASIDVFDWAAIIHTNHQGVILDCAARGDWEMMQSVIEDCRSQSIVQLPPNR